MPPVILEFRAILSLSSTGELRLAENFVKGYRVADGLYEGILAAPLKVEEASIYVTPWYAPKTAPIVRMTAASLGNDGLTVQVAVFNADGKPMDGAFCCRVDRVVKQ